MSTHDGSFHFHTFADLVENGVHLEHLHWFQCMNKKAVEGLDTINLHMDQASSLLQVSWWKDAQEDSSRVWNGFYIELVDASHVQVEFNKDDELMIMLGDGVIQ